MRTPRCTYRFQLHAGFTFDDLAALAPYLRDLGVSDCYCSPIFRATPGSRHGYDVCDYGEINPELGGEEGLRRLATRLREHDIGLLLDFVPNHMGIDGPFNRWWRDVLAHGRTSAYATFFDIEWNEQRETGQARVMAPLLPDHYGVLLEQGKLRLEHQDGELAVVHEKSRFPVRPETYEAILQEIAPEAAQSIRVEPSGATGRWEKGLAHLLESTPDTRLALDACLERLNGRPGEPGNFDELDRLIGSQHYRLTRWQAGAHGTNYRRFFAIDTLVGLRMEDETVFAQSHARLAGLIRDGIVTGLRIDHVDGLRDPEEYLLRLQALAVQEAKDHAAEEDGKFYIIVEKILGPGEQLPAVWATHGTTGYDFIPVLAGIFTEADHEAAFTTIYADFVGRNRAYADVVGEKKRLVLEEMFANTALSLARKLQEDLAIDRRWRDLTLTELVTAVRALLAGFRVYRTYRRQGPAAETDRREIEHACSVAEAANPRIEPAVIRFVRDVLLGDYPEASAVHEHRTAMNAWALTFQQYTGAVMAKAVEDTAYYTYNRLIALNEVGGGPARFGDRLETFHEANRTRLRRCPHALLTTSTHDTKVGEDVRARLYALSEIPGEWREWLDAWRRLNQKHKTRIAGQEAPDADEEYRLYQTLLGAWPLPPVRPDDDFRARIRAYLRKAVNEAKVHTTAIHPNEPWLEACDRFVDALLSPGGEFIPHLQRAATRLAKAGAVTSLSQVTLKLTAPGVPDIYQGNEVWDFSLVDPDNRRDVDFGVRRSRMAEIDNATPAGLLDAWEDGRIKLATIRTLLRFRRERPWLFEEGGYAPVGLEGPLRRHAVGFLRTKDEERLLVIVSRFAAGLPWPPVGEIWADTVVKPGPGGPDWQNLFTGQTVVAGENGAVSLPDILADWPIAVLHQKGR